MVKNIDITKDALSHFGVVGKKIEVLDGGLLNETWKVNDAYVLQRMHHGASDEVHDNYQKIVELFDDSWLHVPRPIGRIAHIDSERWRMFTYLDNARPSCEALSMYEAGKVLGEVHRVLSRADDIACGIEHFHDVEHYRNSLLCEFSKANPAEQMISYSLYSFLADKLNGEKWAGNRQVIHGDPKLNNILFDCDGDGIAMVDWDTCMTGDRMIDIGDAVRSWCRDGVDFKVDDYRDAIKGYNSSACDEVSLTDGLIAGERMSLELSCRYLVDFFRQEYFLLSSKYATLQQQNLSGAGVYAQYAKNIEKSLDEMI